MAEPSGQLTSDAVTLPAPPRPIERESEGTRLQLLDVLERTSDAVMTLDAAGRITYANPAAMRFAGDRATAELLGRAPWELWPVLAELGLDAAFQRVMATGTAVDEEYRLLAPPECDRWLELHAYPAADHLTIFYRDITERRRADEALRDAHQRLEFHADNSPLAIVEWDSRFRISRWSREAEHLFGWSPAEALGRAIYDLHIVHPDDVPIVERAMIEMVDGSASRIVNRNRNLTKDGRVLHCAWHNSALLDAGGRLVSVYSEVLDLTEQTRAARHAARLQATMEALARNLDERSVAATVSRCVREATGALAAGVGLLADDGPPVRFAGLEGFAPPWSAWVGVPLLAPLFAPAPAPAGPTVEPLFVESRAEWEARHPELAGRHAAAGLEAAALVPCVLDGHVLGVLVLGFDGPHRFLDDERSLLAAVALQCAQALERARLFEAERVARSRAEHAADRTRRLQTVTAALSRAATPAAVARVVLEVGVPALGAAAGTVYGLREPDGEHPDGALHSLDSYGFAPPLPERLLTIPLGAHVSVCDAARTRLPVWLESHAARAARYPAIATDPVMRHFGAWAALPLLVDGRCIGTIGFTFGEPRAFDEDERAMMRAFADHCAQALQRARLYESAERARADADRASRAKSDFIAVMSHELRTPLNAIMGYAELLSEGITGPVIPEQRQQLGRIQASARHLLALIEDVLTLSRLEARREAVHPEPLELRALLGELAALMEPSVVARGLTLTVDCAGQTPVRMETDATRLRQIVLNLLANAVKFTDRGGVTLRLRADDREVEIAVEDTGIGIAPEHIAHIFETFWQVDQRRTRTTSGVGLGLDVSQRLARLLGGELRVSSTPGQGSVFTLRLPRAAPRGPDES